MLGALGGVAPAWADPGGQVPPSGPVGGNGGIGARAVYQVHLSGDLKGGGGAMSVGVPPTCWWAPTGKDAQQFSDWYDYYAQMQRGFGSEVWYGMPHPG